MADFQPDTSIYRHSGTPDLGSIVNLVQGLRQIQNQNAMRDAIQQGAGGDPTTPDVPGMQQHYLRNPNALPQPGDISGFANANKAVMDVNIQRAQAAQGFFSAALGYGDNITQDIIRSKIPLLSRYDPRMADMLNKSLAGAPQNGRALKNWLVDLQTASLGGGAAPGVDVTQAGGGVQAKPAPIANREAYGLPTGSGGAPNTNAPIDTLFPPPSQTQASGVPSGTPGLPKQMPTGAEKSIGAMQRDQEIAANYPQDIFPLHKIIEYTKAHPEAFGPGSGGRQKMKEFVYSLAPELVPEGEMENMRDYSDVRKYMVNNTQRNAQAIGPHTNEGLMTAITGSPNTDINGLSDYDLARAQLAMRKMQQAQIWLGQRGSQGGMNYLNEKGRVGALLDPRAFLIDQMEPAERAKLKDLKGKELTRLNESLKAAYLSGVTKRPGQQ